MRNSVFGSTVASALSLMFSAGAVVACGKTEAKTSGGAEELSQSKTSLAEKKAHTQLVCEELGPVVGPFVYVTITPTNKGFLSDLEVRVVQSEIVQASRETKVLWDVTYTTGSLPAIREDTGSGIFNLLEIDSRGVTVGFGNMAVVQKTPAQTITAPDGRVIQLKETINALISISNRSLTGDNLAKELSCTYQ